MFKVGSMFQTPLMVIIKRGVNVWTYKVLKERKPIELAKEIYARFNTNFCDGEYCGFCHICLSIFKHIRFDGSIRQKANLQSNISVVAAATFGTQRVNIAAINKHISAFFMFR